jgi:hypothetical protein
MKHLLNGAAIAVALAIAGPVWAQGQQQSPDNPAVSPNAPPPATTSAAPPMHPAHHVQAMHAHHKAMATKAAQTGDTTAQLNREELARINSGNLGNPPPAAPMPEEQAPPPPPQPKSGSSKYLPTGGPKIN